MSVPPIPTRECTHCHAEKPATAEFFHKNGEYLRPKCKKCSDTTRNRRYGRVKQYYKMDKETLDAMLAQQDGCCAICDEPPPPGQVLHVDHDHSCCVGTPTCGECTRGLLCQNCNRMLGCARDSVHRLEKAIEFLKLGQKSGKRRISSTYS